MKRTMKRVASTLLAALLLLSVGAGALAAEVAANNSITFTNRELALKGLLVRKTVVNAADAPDTAFPFYLTVNGAVAAGETYRLFTAAGQELKLYYDVSSGSYQDLTESQYNAAPNKATLSPMDRTTDANGSFTLRHGQTAVLDGLSYGDRYTVNEGTVANFTQVLPAGGAAAEGTVTQTLAEETFQNRYDDHTPPPDDEYFTELHISKQVVTPGGYDLPVDADFTFKVEVEGEPLALAGYQVLDLQTGAAVGSGVTDENGKFTISGGQEAVFEKVEADCMVTVTEEPAQGWTTVGNGVQSGVTAYDTLYLDFTNRFGSFVVAKTMADGTVPGTPFDFVLSHADGTAWAGAQYYVYQADGTLADKKAKTTDANGAFQLEAGERALFVGIDQGTVFSVREQPTKGFAQVLPADANGYVSETVGGVVKTLPFQNETNGAEGKLTVSKSVLTPGAEAAPDVAFPFQLKVLVDGQYVAVPNALYAIGDSTFKTDDNGRFTLKASQTATFERLKLTATYQVEELPTQNFAAQQARFSEELTQKGVDFAFTNVYNPTDTTQLKVLKVDANDNTRTLSGAKFQVEKLTDTGVVDPGFTAITIRTGSDGTAEVPGGLADGKYQLTEVNAPAFYKLPENLVIVVDTDMTGDPHTLAADGYTVSAALGMDGVRTITVTVANEGVIVDTGVLLDTLPYVLVLVVVGAGAVVLAVRKHHRRAEEN